jgi:hypothetical protein
LRYRHRLGIVSAIIVTLVVVEKIRVYTGHGLIVKRPLTVSKRASREYSRPRREYLESPLACQLPEWLSCPPSPSQPGNEQLGIRLETILRPPWPILSLLKIKVTYVQVLTV